MASPHKHSPSNKKGNQTDTASLAQSARDQALSKQILALREENYDTQQGWAILADNLSAKTAEATTLASVSATVSAPGVQQPQQPGRRPRLFFWQMAVAAMLLLVAGFLAGRYSKQNQEDNKGQLAVRQLNIPTQTPTTSRSSTQAADPSIITVPKKEFVKAKSVTKSTGLKQPDAKLVLKTDAYAISNHGNKVRHHNHENNKGKSHAYTNKIFASASPTATSSERQSAEQHLNKSTALAKTTWQGPNKQVIDGKLWTAATPTVTSKHPVASTFVTNNSIATPSAAPEPQQDKNLPVIALSTINMEPMDLKGHPQIENNNKNKKNIYKTLSRNSGASTKFSIKIRF